MAREGLREKARPYTEEQRLEDYASQIARIEKLHADVANTRPEKGTLEGDETKEGKKKHDASTKAIDGAQEEIKRLEEAVEQKGSWQFDSDEVAWRHEVLSDLLAGLAKIDAGDGTGALVEVRKRHDFVTALHQRSIEDYRAKWDTGAVG